MSEAESKVETKEPQEEKKKASRPKEKAPKEVVEPVRASSRSVKKPERFEPENAQHEFKAAEIVKGKGEKLGEIANVEARLAKTKPKEGYLKKLYRIVFPGASVKETQIKKDLRDFSGFKDTSEEHTKQVAEKLSKFDMNALRNIADLLDVERSNKKEELAEHIAAFLNKPVSSGRPLRAKKSGGGKTKEKSEKSGSGRGASAYILFSNEQRPKLKAENPGISFGDMGKLCGAKWKELSEEEKQKYKDAAAKVAPKDKTTKKRKASTKKEGTKKKKSKKAKSSSDDTEEKDNEDDEAGGDEDDEEAGGDDDDEAGDDADDAGADE